jgi:hypothetical protein
MAVQNSADILREGGKGSKDRRAAVALEVFATLDSTHGNSAQAKSLHAILDRALERYNRKVARKAAKAAKVAAEVAPVKASKSASKSASKASKPRKARTVEVEDAKAVEDDAPARESFVARMRALAADAEASGERV